jgi:predicted DNA-binding protein (UPF0251 family)
MTTSSTGRARLPTSSVLSSVTEYLELRDMGITHEAAARRIGVSVNTMENRIKRARGRGDI